MHCAASRLYVTGLTLKQIKVELKERHAVVGGTRPELLERIRQLMLGTYVFQYVSHTRTHPSSSRHSPLLRACWQNSARNDGMVVCDAYPCLLVCVWRVQVARQV